MSEQLASPSLQGLDTLFETCKHVEMVDLSREMIAYTLMGLIGMLALPWFGIALRRRHRDKLRRRGIKRFGH